METAWIGSSFNGDSCWNILGNVAFMRNGDAMFVREIVRSWSVLKGFIKTLKAEPLEGNLNRWRILVADLSPECPSVYGSSDQQVEVCAPT